MMFVLMPMHVPFTSFPRGRTHTEKGGTIQKEV
jgi:hypothetical protein